MRRTSTIAACALLASGLWRAWLPAQAAAQKSTLDAGARAEAPFIEFQSKAIGLASGSTWKIELTPVFWKIELTPSFA
jgi:hypothetical protein